MTQKSETIRPCRYLCQMLTDFRNSFTGRLKVKFAISWSFKDASEKFLKLVNIRRMYRQECSASFFESQCIHERYVNSTDVVVNTEVRWHEMKLNYTLEATFAWIFSKNTGDACKSKMRRHPLCPNPTSPLLPTMCLGELVLFYT